MELTLKISSEASYVLAEILEKTGIRKRKKISMQDAVDILNNSVDNDRIIRIGRLPEGFLDAEFDFSSVTGKIAVFVPMHTQLMDFNGEKAFIPFPSLILVFKFHKGVHQKTNAFATVEESSRRINGETVLYNYPFGNVSPGTGLVCWGINRHEPIRKIQDVNIFTDKFLNSPTNSDLYQAGISNASKLKLNEFLLFLTEKYNSSRDAGTEYIFDNSLLVPTINTLDSVFRSEY